MPENPTAYLESLRLLNQWKDGDTDFGDPTSWPDDHILVIDSLSRWCDACYNLHDQATPKTSSSGSQFDGRAAFFSAQEDMEKQIATLTCDQLQLQRHRHRPWCLHHTR